MEFYKVLIEIMKEKDLTIPDVARLSGLADSTIRSIINRKNKTVALEVAFKLAKGLNVSLERLNGEMESDEEKSTEILTELYEVAKGLSENEQLYLLDMVKALKQRLKE